MYIRSRSHPYKRQSPCCAERNRYPHPEVPVVKDFLFLRDLSARQFLTDLISADRLCCAGSGGKPGQLTAPVEEKPYLQDMFNKELSAVAFICFGTT